MMTAVVFALLNSSTLLLSPCLCACLCATYLRQMQPSHLQLAGTLATRMQLNMPDGCAWHTC